MKKWLKQTIFWFLIMLVIHEGANFIWSKTGLWDHIAALFGALTFGLLFGVLFEPFMRWIYPFKNAVKKDGSAK